MKYSFIIVCLLFGVSVYAQQNSRFFISPHIDIVKGENATDPSFGLTTGIVFKQYRIGLGAAIDYHFFRTIPVYASLEKQFGKKPSGFFVLGNAGINIPSVKVSRPEYYFIADGISEERSYFNGYFLQGGCGYRIGLNSKKQALSVVLLLSRKTFVSKSDEWMYNGFIHQRLPRETNLKLDRTVLRIAFEF